MQTEYKINQILKDVAINLVTSDYTDRELDNGGNKITCYCQVASQKHNMLYPRYTVTWKTSLEEGYIQAAFHYRCPEIGTSFMRIAKITPTDNDISARDKIENAFISGLKRGKAIYDGE